MINRTLELSHEEAGLIKAALRNEQQLSKNFLLRSADMVDPSFVEIVRGTVDLTDKLVERIG